MINKHCNTCGVVTPHNPLKAKGEYRCTQCGQPRRPGQKNFGVRINGKVIMEAKPS